MPVPRIAIVGRPNVGKSSLLNLIARERVAIVDPTPGVTRDRVSVVVGLEPPDPAGEPKPAEITDTGGYGVYVADGERFDDIGADLSTLTKDIEHQIGAAVETADLILFCVDCQAGITPQDLAIAKMLREQKLGHREGPPAPVRVVATKCDGPSWEAHAYELSSFGFGDPMLVSSKTKYFRRDMLDTLYEILPERHDEPEPEVDLKLAIVGKRNAGKSTLVNTLAGQPRVIVSEIAGTTRDAIDVKFELNGRSIMAIDTAGLRRKKSFQNQIEWYALDRSERAIARADVVLLLIDAESTISQVDQQLAQLVVASHKPVVIVVNKWDAVESRADQKGRPVTPERYENYVRKELKGLPFAPIALMSAQAGFNVDAVIDLAFDLHAQSCERVGTGQLNRVVREIVEHRGPTNKLGVEAKVYFASQVRTNPPMLVLVVNNPEFFTHNYERYLMNQFRDRLPFAEVPIKLILRSRARVEKRAAARGGSGTRLHEVDAETGAIIDDISPETINQAAFLEGLPDDAAAYFDD
ncbi:MAG: GTPase Der [Phycisphaeraceae bacterium]|nr:MAG: GTPase Der [Phycisphaeraceae bacterium]